MLQQKPGSYVLLGAGNCRESLHNPNYNFNNEVLPLGASYRAELVKDMLQFRTFFVLIFSTRVSVIWGKADILCSG